VVQIMAHSARTFLTPRKQKLAEAACLFDLSEHRLHHLLSQSVIAETRVPIPMKPGRAARIDYEDERNGTANLFMLFASLEARRHIKVTDRHRGRAFVAR